MPHKLDIMRYSKKSLFICSIRLLTMSGFRFYSQVRADIPWIKLSCSKVFILAYKGLPAFITFSADKT